MRGFRTQNFGAAGLILSLSLCLQGGLLTGCNSQEKAETLSTTNDDTSSGIIGGREVLAQEKLAQNVALLVNSATGVGCTAVLITDEYALTAAHCIAKAKYGDLTLYFTTQFRDFNQNDTSLVRRVHGTRISPYYAEQKDKDTDAADIAILRFSSGLPQGYEPARILNAPEALTNGLGTIIAGYGNNDSSRQTGSGVLRATQVEIKNVNFSPTEITVDQSQGRGACHGDSGGPAYVKINGEFYLWGLTSRPTDDDPNGNCNTSAIYTNVLVWLPWIKQTVANWPTRHR